MGDAEEMPHHGRRNEPEISGTLEARRLPNVLGDDDQMPYHGARTSHPAAPAFSAV